jgi:hypothetical protein
MLDNGPFARDRPARSLNSGVKERFASSRVKTLSAALEPEPVRAVGARRSRGQVPTAVGLEQAVQAQLPS